MWVWWLVVILLAACGGRADAAAEAGYSLDLVTQQAAFSPRDSGSGLAFDGGVYLMGGFTPERSNEIWRSDDGARWEPMPEPLWSPRNLARAAGFRGRMWIMGGFDGSRLLNDVYSTADGATWRAEGAAPWAARSAFGLAVVDDRMLVFGGNGADGALADVWAFDGERWDSLGVAPWAPRGMFGFAVHDGRACLMGGGEYDERYVYNVRQDYADVWCGDGEDWEQVADSAEFGPRRFHRAVSYRGAMLVIGGFQRDPRLFDDVAHGEMWDSLSFARRWYLGRRAVGRDYGNLSDVWRSPDGRRWERVSVDGLPARHAPAVAQTDTGVLIIGGFGADLFNDVWRFTQVR